MLQYIFLSSSRDLQSDCGAWLIHTVKMLRALLRHGRNATTVLPRILRAILSLFQNVTMKFCEYPPFFFLLLTTSEQHYMGQSVVLRYNGVAFPPESHSGWLSGFWLRNYLDVH